MDWTSPQIDALLEQALIEDQATNDVTTRLTVDPDLRATATILARQDLIVAGVGAVPHFFRIFSRLLFDRRPGPQAPFDVFISPGIADGVRASDGQVLATIRHKAQPLLSCERVILNLMQHLSGIATATRRFVDAIEGTGARVLDTRKTLPGMRVLEKYAVACGGGMNHRMDLATGILIKNNHISLGHGVRRAVTSALAGRPGSLRVQVEVRSPEELEEALGAGAESVLLDNMRPEEVKWCVERIHKEGARKIPIEASGGIVLENIRAYAEAGVDFISAGALTHSAPAADISMRIAADAG